MRFEKNPVAAVAVDVAAGAASGGLSRHNPLRSQ